MLAFGQNNNFSGGINAHNAIVGGNTLTIGNASIGGGNANNGMFVGYSNTLQKGDDAAIIGGTFNNVGKGDNASTSSVVVGGTYNNITGNANRDFIGGGTHNSLTGNYSIIG